MTSYLRGAVANVRAEPAVAFALAGRTWQLVAAPITLVTIAATFSPETQGFYYTFASLIALQSFVELGLAIVIVNVASHEWATLRLDGAGQPEGNRTALSRLASLARLTVAWYGVASLLFIGVVSVVGVAFFSRADAGAVSWKLPWIALVTVAGAQLWMLSFTSVLEGCNQVATVYRFRLVQVVCTSGAFWITAVLGGGLWAGVAAATVRLATDVSLVTFRYRRFFGVLLGSAPGPGMNWRTEIWPMQWRLALSGVVNYFAYSLFNPVMFRYHGAAAAGQMGMSLQAVGGLQSLSQVMLTTRVPEFGALIAKGAYPDLDRRWTHVGRTSLAVLSLGAVALLGVTVLMQIWQPAVGSRLLPIAPTALLLAAAILMHVSQCETAYMRAHRQEPIVVLSVVTSIMAGAAVWFVGSRRGALGATAGYAAVMLVLVVWETIVWVRFRRAAIEAARGW